jgi:hypothetical protein
MIVRGCKSWTAIYFHVDQASHTPAVIADLERERSRRHSTRPRRTPASWLFRWGTGLWSGSPYVLSRVDEPAAAAGLRCL